MNLLIVVVNYRTAGLAIDCLRSLEDEVRGLPETRVVVTDNASGDDSVARLEAAVRDNGWDGWATVQPLEKNGGFAFGNNAAIRPALASDDPPRYVLLLNPDTVVRPGALATLLDFMDARPDVGLAGSRLEGPDGAAHVSAFRFHSVLGELEDGLRLGLASRLLSRWSVWAPVPETDGPTDWVAGACLIVRRAVFETVGLMNERYFMYFEEVDFCLRARRAGWPCWYVPRARVVHLVGKSSGVTDVAVAKQKRRPPYWFQSRRRFFLTNHGRARTVLADLAWSSAFATYRVRRFLQRKPDTDPRLLLWDFLRHNFLPPVGP
jgi:N-acetylglucosaminyl-diphospho-decaprenol L-rhamnosyltransferase